MKQNKYIFLYIPVIIILTLVTLIIISKKSAEFLYCSPTTPRGNDLAKWQETITLKSQNTQFDKEFLDKFEVYSDNEKYTLKYPDTSPPDDPFAFEPHELIPGQPLKIGNGTLNFLGLGVAFCDANHISGQDVPYKFFDINFQPEKEEIINSLWQYETSEQESYFRYSPWPVVQLGLEYQGIEDVMFSGIKIFDARTHKSIATGSGSKGLRTNERATHKFSVDIPFWHHAPVDIVFDVSFGPSKVHEFLPKANEGFEEEGFECRLIDVFEDINPHNYGQTRHDNMKVLELFKATPNKEGLRFIFACLPTSNSMPVTFSFLDKDGKILPGPFSSTTDFIHNLTFGQPLEKFAMIRAKYRTNRYRIILHLPYIPGMPEQNQKIDNLFDVYIPYVKLYDESQANRFLYETLQLDHLTSTGQRPDNSIQSNSFPIVFSEVTIRDIAKTYTTGGTVNADIENDTLEKKYPIPFLTKLKMLFYKIRQNNNE